MTCKNRKFKTTLSRELLFIIVAATIAAFFMSLALSWLTSHFLDSRFATDEYYQAEDAKIISSLESYIKEYKVSSDDWYSLNKWVDANPVTYITIYKEGRLAYLSDLSEQKERSKLEHETSYEQSVAYQVKFMDGECDVIIFGNYASVYYKVAYFIKIVIPFLFFFAVLLTVIRRKVRYIALLDQDVELLKSGEYDHEIHIEGRDELTTLAKSIDQMRNAYNQKIDEINRLFDDNKEFITEMSHDMRTPMTPLLVYLGMLRDKRYENEEEHDNYVLKANEKAVQLKHMSDNMFASLLVNQKEEIKLTVMTMNVAFYDQMSALADYLGTEGFRIDAGDVTPSDARVRVNLDFMARIFNNIMSNILKYADKEEPIRIVMNAEEETVIIRFSNAINELADYSSSTGFGVKNIRKMMVQMNAECVVDQQEDSYSIELRFPVVSEEIQEETSDGEPDGPARTAETEPAAENPPETRSAVE